MHLLDNYAVGLDVYAERHDIPWGRLFVVLLYLYILLSCIMAFERTDFPNLIASLGVYYHYAVEPIGSRLLSVVVLMTNVIDLAWMILTLKITWIWVILIPNFLQKLVLSYLLFKQRTKF